MAYRKLLALPLVLAVLAGCTVLTGEPGHTVHVPPEAARLRFVAGPFAGDPVQALRFADRWQVEEYAFFEAGGHRAEVLYAAARDGDTLALEHALTVQRAAATWRFNAGGDLAWGPLGRGRTVFTQPVFYRPYRLAGEDRPCAAFIADWDLNSDDPRKRPDRLLFGCYCTWPGETLSDEEIQRLLGALRVTNETPARAASGAAPAAVGAASTGAHSGNTRFPLRLAVHYVVGNGGKRNR